MGADLAGEDAVEQLRAAGCVFAEEEAALLRGEPGRDLDEMLRRRVAGEPLEHILGWVDFCGRRVAVGPGVFVPRQRSRVLVAAALAALPGPGVEPQVVLEVCCGAAAVAAVVSHARPDAQVWACDLDPAAVEMARRNLPRERVRHSDLFDGVPPDLAGAVAVVVANAPYVPTGQIPFMPSEARAHEPLTALDGGPDGVSFHRLIAAQVGRWLAPDGSVVVETSRRQLAATRAAFTDSGFHTTVSRDEDIDGTAVVARF